MPRAPDGAGANPLPPAADAQPFAVVIPTVLAAAGVLTAAIASLAQPFPDWHELVALLALLAAATFVEALPVPIRGLDAGVSLAALFLVSTAVLYGWAPAAILAAITRGAIEIKDRRPTIRFAYNTSVYALSGAAAGLVISQGVARFHEHSLVLEVGAASMAFYATNLLLVALVVARVSGERVVLLAQKALASTAVPLGIMASIALMLSILWMRSPFYAASLVGPLLAVGLYQRSVQRALDATELALSDALTGLGNHRHFHECLGRELERAEAESLPLNLCLLDIDDLKQINDRHGHPAGDRAIVGVAACLRDAGDAFRLGGDEFALILPGHDTAQARAAVQGVLDRIATSDFGHPVAVSAGLASPNGERLEQGELIAIADRALYGAKGAGKGVVEVYRPESGEVSSPKALEDDGRSSRLRAAVTLAGAADSRDPYQSGHSREVAALGARIAERLGLPAERIELIRMAGTVHDIGKLGIAEEILLKPGPLSDTEREAMKRHALIGFQMLSSLGIDLLPTWVLHHHENWDGTGYPHGLEGEQIPLESRILLAADAFNSMTTDRVYRIRLPRQWALEELNRCAGTQFDPAVISALVELLTEEQVEPTVPSRSAAAR